MAIQTRNSALAIKPETTEGTPVVPAAGTDFVALQDDFAIDPAFAVLENAELKASLGSSKPILGVEEPTASFSHYMRHSGVEGQAPGFNELLKASFGEEVVESVEYDTVAASTTTAINVDTGEGAQFERGQGMLVKNSAGYEIMPIHSVAGDVLTPAFALQNAPGTGVNLGKCVFYKPANSGHQTLSLWHYVGNQGALQMMAGARVVDVSIEFPAGDLINASYSLEGLSYYFNPVTITATNKYLDFDDAGGEENASVAEKTYKDPHELADAIAVAMNALTGDTITVTYSDSTGKWTIASDGATFSLLWNTGTNTANTIGGAIGFDVAADDTGSTSYEGDNAIDLSNITPSFDSADPLAAKANRLYIGDQDDNACIAASSVSFTLGTPKADILSICAESGKSGSVINAREATISVTQLLEQYDVDRFKRFREGQETRLAYVFGNKSGGNWIAGKSGYLYMPTATITSFSITEADGLATLEMELQSFVDSDGNGEVYLGFL